jgi:hypothetical protein
MPASPSIRIAAGLIVDNAGRVLRGRGITRALDEGR